MSQQTSTGTADVKTFTPPIGAKGVLLTVETNGCRISFDGSTPGATSVLLPTTAAGPMFIPAPGNGGRGQSIQVASSIAGNSVVTAQFLA
jgi:hypothetical protein